MEDTSRRKPRVWFWVALAVVFSATAALGADARANEPSLVQRGLAPLDDWNSAPPVSKVCNGPSKSLRKVYESGTMCGTRGRDKKLKVPDDAPITVYALGGNDTIIAKGQVNIYGGPGKDSADVTNDKLASCWDTESVHDARNKPLKCAKSKRSLMRATDFDPSKEAGAQHVIWRTPSVKCWSYTSGTWFVRFADEPLLRAFSVFKGKVEFQRVAYAAALYKWDAAQSSWVQYRSPVWVWDETVDRDGPAPPELNYWRAFDTLKRTELTFNITPSEPGYYQVMVTYHWYPTVQTYQGKSVNVPAYDVKPKLVYYHFGLSNEKTAKFARDRYCAFGVPADGGP